ncbi:McrC family protein [Gulosibacter sp. 10]|uniref:McrC family protein n=1 Tax=Gulosibacter sp. 10 TaxID=1255570 RepID=UPI0020CEB078|nr:McrC family protein [Gulosibacter sp. 10]
MPDVDPVPAPETVWFQASERGNGIGLTVLQRKAADRADPQWLFVYVLPKLWRESGGRSVVVRLDDPAARHTTIAVHEQDILGLPLAWGAVLRDAILVGREPEPVDGEEPTEEEDAGVRDRLWTEVVDPRMEASPAGDCDERTRDGFWKLIEEEATVLLVDPPPGASVLLGDPAARRTYLRLFLQAAGEQVARRRPEFISTTEPLNTVRGRLLADRLVQRAARRTVPVWCEFDSLTADTRMWQAVRRAAMVCAAEMGEDADLLELAMEVDARLNDVAIESIAEVLAQANEVAAAVRERQLKSLHRVATAILRHEVLLAEPSDADAEGLVFMFKVPTSEVWERLVAEAVNTTGAYRAVRHPEGKALFAAGVRKAVDIAVYRGGADGRLALVLDGKYKRAPGGLRAADMKDQYQIYAYANLWGVPALLAYPGSGPSARSRARMSAALENRGERSGIVELPFPRPGERAIPATAAELVEVLDRARQDSDSR